MRRIWVMAGLLALAGCGQSSNTPLSHGIAALRAGDYAELQKAKAEAAEELKTAIQPGDDLCKATPNDVTKYVAQSRLAKFDHQDLFALPEEERLIYALNVAGNDDERLDSDSFLKSAPLFHFQEGGGDDMAARCHMEQGEAMHRLMDNSDLHNSRFEATAATLKAWIEATQQRLGDSYEGKMRDAAAHLGMVGYASKWPPETWLIPGAKQMPTFQQVQTQAGH